MRIASLITFAAGLAIAGGSAYSARDYLEGRMGGPATVKPQSVSVVMAAQDIAFGNVIEAAKLRVAEWPADLVPPGAITDIATLLPKGGNEPRRARRAINQGEPLNAAMVSDFGEKVTIVQSLAAGHRAMSIKVNAETGVAGFVTPGDRVDILLTQGRNESLKTVTILQNTRVIGIDQTADVKVDSPEVARTVTVEVTPEEGQRLALAQSAGTLSLTLRTLEASNDTPLESIGLKDVLRELSPFPSRRP
ncbi:Flp pilus assembly protein CpaB [Seohaeicola zhoushanensis]